MGLFSSSNKEQNIDWVALTSEDQMNDLMDLSEKQAVLFFKHSTRCSISSMAKSRLEREWNLKNETVLPVYLDLISFRSISNKLAEELKVTHQSPQAILVIDKTAVYDASHNQIDLEKIKSHL